MPPCRLENAEDSSPSWSAIPRSVGHFWAYHCAVDAHHHGYHLLVTPSTCVNGEHPSGPQAPEGRPFWEVHGSIGAPGVSAAELYPNGTIVT